MALPAQSISDGVLTELSRCAVTRTAAASGTEEMRSQPRVSQAVRGLVEYSAAAALLRSLEILPVAIALPLAEWAGIAFGSTIGRWRRVAQDNLRAAMPGLDAVGRRAVICGVYRNLGRVALALAKLPRWSRDQVRRHVQFEGMEHFLAARAKGRGVLLLTAHLGNWELGALAHGAVAGPMGVVVRPLPNRRLDRLVESRRSAHGNRVIAKRGGAREIFRELSVNGTVGILADQHASTEEAVRVEFFGMPAAANKGFAQIALRSGAAVVPAMARWDRSKRQHVVTYLPEIDVQRSKDPSQDVAINTQRFQSALEELIRESPEQWLWIHRRWKAFGLSSGAR